MEEERIKPYAPAVNYWLLGTDPLRRIFADPESQLSTKWDGVTDYVALKFLEDIDAGDLAMVCETGDEPRIVGLVRTVSDPYPDPLQDDPRFLAAPVPLDDLAAEPDFRDLDLEDLGELSVAPLTPRLWERVVERGRERAREAGSSGTGGTGGPEGDEGVLVGTGGPDEEDEEAGR